MNKFYVGDLVAFEYFDYSYYIVNVNRYATIADASVNGCNYFIALAEKPILITDIFREDSD